MQTLPALESLRCFVEAARHLSFRAAAGVVSLTPAALGQRIRQLEVQLGVSLFERTTRKVVLTEAGLRLLPQAQLALGAVLACGGVARGEGVPAPQDLAIGTRHELGMSWIRPMLSRLRTRHPGITFHLYFGSGSDILLRVRAGEINCAVGSMRVDDPRLDSIPLHREDYVLVGAPRLMSRQPFRRSQDARHHTLIDERPALPLYSYLRDALPAADRMAFERILYLGTIAAIRDAILDGEGVGVLPAYFVADALRKRRLVRLLPGTKASHDLFRLIFRADDPRRSLYQALADSLRASPLQ